MKKFLFCLLLISAVPVFGEWDVTTPAGTEAKSLGDDRIRELKTDIQTALQYGSTQYFPGADTSNPRYIPTISTFTTAGRPSGNFAPVGRMIMNVSSKTLETVDSSGAWSALDTVPNSSILPIDLSTGVAGNGLVGGGGTVTELSVNVDPAIFTITTDSITFVANPVIHSSFTFAGSVNFQSKPCFLAFNSATDSNVTGTGSNTTVDFDTEVFDTSNSFTGDTFTAPVTGKYLLITHVYLSGITTNHVSGELGLVTSNRSYSDTFGGNLQNARNAPVQISVIADMDIGDTASVVVKVSATDLTVDVIGDGTTLHTFFSGEFIQ